VLSILRLSQAGYRKMAQNLGWALGYNVLALPIAAGVAAPIGLTIPPGLAAILMSVSTIIVVLNAQLLRGLELRPAHVAG
jgi:Cu2+-exporting ATPase